MKHLEQQILDLITDEVFAKRLANELFIAMQKNDIYEQVKFESRESIEANIERLEKELETERKKLDIVIPQAKAFNELQKDVDKALDDINQEKYRAHHSLVVSRLKLQDKDENYINKLIYDNMTFSELDDLIKDKPVPLSNEILYRWAMASIPLDVLNDVINRTQKRISEMVSCGNDTKLKNNLKEKYDLFYDIISLNGFAPYIADKVIINNMMGHELIDVVNSIPLRNNREISNSDIVEHIDIQLFADILDRIKNNKDDLEYLKKNAKKYKKYRNNRDENQIAQIRGDCSLPKANEYNELQRDRDMDGAIDKKLNDEYNEKCQFVVNSLNIDGEINYKNLNAIIYNHMMPEERNIIFKDNTKEMNEMIWNNKIIAVIPQFMLQNIVERIKSFCGRHGIKLRFTKEDSENDIKNEKYKKDKKDENENQVVKIGGGCSLPKGFAANLRLEKKVQENKNQGTEENDTAIDYFDGKGSNAIGLGKSEAERKETLRERAKKAWEKYRNK